MEELARLIKCGEDCLGGGSTKSPEFKSFARKFNNRLKKQFSSIGGRDYKGKVGHFYISGFVDVQGQTYYFSISDVRHGFGSDILVRTAKDRKDFSGGSNNYIPMDSDFAENFKRTFNL
jgi:hypothetical protein